MNRKLFSPSSRTSIHRVALDGSWDRHPAALLSFIKDTHPVESEETTSTAYALVERSTGNLLGPFKTEREALEEVTASITHYGGDAVETLALGYSDPAGAALAIE